MLTIRLQRVGKKNEPTFRLVLTDSKNGPKSGKFLEILGSYDSREKNETKFNSDKIKAHMANGAKLSDTVHNLLVDMKIIDGKKINVLPKKTPIKKEEAVVAETAPESTPEPEVSSETTDTPAEDSTPVSEPEPVSAEPTEESTPEPTKTEETPAEVKEETPAPAEEVAEEKPAE